ncbi:hypothetical protein [Streptomyces sp. NBC_01236]|uniref:hypothetical protein n=1 Tax=Streptomyces sp. NBC_01236 TaxID=2903789 RepID=UPI002E0F3FCD|nr:hypothetical protein OG324_39255 [Streptomyces sp. NBC_01236]
MPGGHVEHGDVYEGGDDGDRHEGRGRHEQDGAGGAQPERARHPQPEDARQSGGGQRQRAPEPCAERPEERRGHLGLALIAPLPQGRVQGDSGGVRGDDRE